MRLACLALLLAAGTAAAAAPQLSVGFGEADVTPALDPKKPVYLGGFGLNRVATKVHDPLFARAVVLSDGTKKIALVSVDVVGLFYPLVEGVRGQLKGFDYVGVSSTHSHDGPDTLGLWGRTPFESGADPDYLRQVAAGIVTAVTAAEAARKDATASVGTAADASLLRDGRLPVVKHDELVVIRFDPAETKGAPPLGAIVQWNVHPEMLDSRNTVISADHVGYTVGALKKVWGCPVAYFTGTVGGLMTNLGLTLKDDRGIELKDGTFEKAERYGREVAKLAERAEAKAVPAALVPFDLRPRVVLVPVENPLYRLSWAAGVLKRPMYAWPPAGADPAAWTPLADVKKPGAVKTEVGFLRLGELDVAAVPGEIYPELVLDKIQDPADPAADYPDAPKEPALYPQMAGKYRMILGLANDEIGYVLPKRQWDEKPPFCYGRTAAQYGEANSCGPDAAKALCDAFRAAAKGK